MTWLAFKIACKKVWLWCKAHWQLIASVLLSVLFLLVFRRKDVPNITDILEANRNNYVSQIQHLDDIHKAEIAKQEEASLRAVAAYKEVQQKFEDEQKTLTAREEKEIKRVIEKNKSDPDALANELAKLTGFKISKN